MRTTSCLDVVRYRHGEWDVQRKPFGMRKPLAWVILNEVKDLSRSVVPEPEMEAGENRCGGRSFLRQHDPREKRPFHDNLS
jgi:hypothetical protein